MNEILNKIYPPNKEVEMKFDIPRIDISNKYKKTGKDNKIEMKINLDKDDLINLVKGISPNYSVFDYPLIKNNGKYIGGFVDERQWNFQKDLTEEELLEIYYVCKNG